MFVQNVINYVTQKLLKMDKVVLNNSELGIIINILEDRIDMYRGVHERTKKDNWLTTIEELNIIKEKILNQTKDEN